MRVRAERRLRAKDIDKLPPGVHEDGGGLRLVVEPSGARRWALRVTIDGKRHSKGLGPYPLISLDGAREEAIDIRRAARQGRDLALEHVRTKAVSFRKAFEAWFEVKKQGLTDAAYARQMPVVMARYVYPFIGDRPVSAVTHAEVVEVVRSVWFEKPQLARRLLQRMDVVFKSAIAHGRREKASPCEGVPQLLGGAQGPVEHRLALPYAEVPGFILGLRSCRWSPAARLACEWQVLTATRNKETRGAAWSEIDEEAALWTIPAVRMKGRRKDRRNHVVPLSRRCMAILREARALNPTAELLFPGRGANMLSHTTFSRILGDLGLAERATGHGFRSSFKDWAAETGVRDEVSEACLAHADTNRVRAAYRRTSFNEERRKVMEAWAEHCAPA